KPRAVTKRSWGPLASPQTCRSWSSTRAKRVTSPKPSANSPRPIAWTRSCWATLLVRWGPHHGFKKSREAQVRNRRYIGAAHAAVLGCALRAHAATPNQHPGRGGGPGAGRGFVARRRQLTEMLVAEENR